MQFLKNNLTFCHKIVCIYRKNLVSYKIALVNYIEKSMKILTL